MFLMMVEGTVLEPAHTGLLKRSLLKGQHKYCMRMRKLSMSGRSGEGWQ